MALGWVKKLLGQTTTTTTPAAASPPIAVEQQPMEPAPRPPTPVPPFPVAVVAAPAPPSPVIVQTETVVRFPWLAPYDVDMEKLGYDGVHAKLNVPAGTSVLVNAPQQRARIIEPNGKVRSWHRNLKMTYDPGDKSWVIVWFEIGGESDPQIQFSPMQDDCEDEIVQATGYEFYCDGVEGKEDSYFPQLAALLRDPFYNPAGFPLKSGIYKEDSIRLCMQLDFGEDGKPPRMAPVPETVPAQLEFPYRTEIDVGEGVMMKGEPVPPGYYRTKAGSFNTITGEIVNMEVRHLSNKYRTSGAEIIQLIHEEKVTLLNVLQDKRPNF